MRYTTHSIRTQNGLLRLCFPELRDWSGEVRISGVADDPSAPLAISVSSDPGFGPPLDIRIEESTDGIDWVERSWPAPRTRLASDVRRRAKSGRVPEAARRRRKA